MLSELAEKLDPAKLVAAAATVAIPWAQRLGYLLERVGASEKVAPLKAYVRGRVHESALLLPSVPSPRAMRTENLSRDDDWKLYLNAQVEPEL